MTTPLRNVFVCCAAPRRNLDDELLVSTTPVSPLAHRKRRGYTPKNTVAVNQTHGTIWTSRRASYAHSAKASSQNRATATNNTERHHSMDIQQALLVTSSSAHSARTLKCDTPSTSAPDSPKATSDSPKDSPSPPDITPSKESRYKDAESSISIAPPLETRPSNLKSKKAKKKSSIVPPSYEISPPSSINDSSFISYTSPLVSETPEPSPRRAPSPPPPILKSFPSKASMAPASLTSSHLVPIKPEAPEPSPRRPPSPPPPIIKSFPSKASMAPVSLTSSHVVPMKPVSRRLDPIPSTVIPSESEITSEQAGPISHPTTTPRSATIRSPTHLPSTIRSPAHLPSENSNKGSKGPVVATVDVARSANFACPHKLSVTRRRQRPLLEDPAARSLAPPVTFDFAQTSVYKQISEEVTNSTRPGKEELLETVKEMGNLLVLRGLQVEEVWMSGRKFPKRKLHIFVSKDFTSVWWDADIRHSCELSNVTGTFSWRQMLRLSRLHPYLMSDAMRELSDQERRRLVAFEAVNHNGYLTRHWFLCASPKVAEDFATCLGLFKL